MAPSPAKQEAIPVEQVPDWAILKALDLMEYGGIPLATVKRDPNEHYEVIAFARFIAEHEEEPDDPLLIEAREIVAAWYEAHPDKVYAGNNPEKIRGGGYDDRAETEQALAALRRGIEIGGSK